MDENLELIRKTLRKYSQEHLLNGYERLDEVKQKQLLGQIETTDFELINSLYNNTRKELEKSDDTITPIEFLDKEKLNGFYIKIVPKLHRSTIGKVKRKLRLFVLQLEHAVLILGQHAVKFPLAF